ncbi:hypothetical protein SALBM311S_08143 [Streptomyces alboniger]
MRRNTRTAEDVGDEHVGRIRGGRLQPDAGVRRVHGDARALRQRQVLQDQVQQGAVGLDDVLPGAGPGRGQIAGG